LDSLLDGKLRVAPSRALVVPGGKFVTRGLICVRPAFSFASLIRRVYSPSTLALCSAPMGRTIVDHRPVRRHRVASGRAKWRTIINNGEGDEVIFGGQDISHQRN